MTMIPVALILCADLTNGLAQVIGPMLIGRPVEGVWHTSIVVRGREYFFGGGVNITRAGESPFGQPQKKLKLGMTQLPPEIIRAIAEDLGQSKFRQQDYNLIKNNCNHFSHTFSSLICGEGIPESTGILNQHEVLLDSPMGPQLAPILAAMESQLGGATVQGFGQAGAQQPS
ncbi:PPPDE putative peptidase domain-containing protein [Dunaliella salina]|uniref:PPPDE putative peptidase domain-containing protein n=1 Tax=Dunaliella salina TaxID=3046 RepID=A0ABQ7GCU8_DUNSA|nr:PPPDE putative peptidase domain-containing protein [Dunaliella salina]|eukprot:KAF5832430.1 PPPDE putative peptidase domain-containing protein [Dunaliella salina]